jgi:nitrite reductase (NADH) small subunit
MRRKSMSVNSPSWFDIGSLDQIPKRGARLVKTPRRDIAVFRTAGDEVFALENRCPHRGGPLSEGIVHGRKVACPLHNLIVDLESGDAAGDGQGCARSFPVKIEKGRVYLEMSAAVRP